MDILIKFLIALAFTVIILSAIYLFGCPIISEYQMKVLPGIAISSGVLVASLSYLKDKEKFKDERQVKHDEFQLRIAKEGFEEVYNLLKDLNNSRVVWIRASRVLLNTLKLGSSIKSEQIKEAYEIIK
ncbi:hypothetical protein [uncultured Pseudoteredinibacter sp.]|uniref:hypothetical protein n=1 Tax=uncultured Pseudoteredinibacter sp. TaxID=1641701 RepID=UPI002618D3CE|nr:hypothetical protein [uncultured Pseudoteredinibacter sp.]